MRPAAIVGVFGSREPETPEAAKLVGQEVARAGHILLTGGSGSTGSAVKATAIAGADASQGRWVGVERTDFPEKPDQSPDERWIVLRPGYQHKRNFVEASLCDAAIAFPGGDGTASEVAFCVALGRPVVLLGDHWRDRPLSDPNELNALRERAQRRMMKDEIPWPPLDDLIFHALGRLDTAQPQCEYRPVPRDRGQAQEVVGAVLTLLGDARPGRLPGLDAYTSVAELYYSWRDRRPPTS